MPQLVKGGKWVFGWVVIGPRREIPIPLEAYLEYGFQAGDEVVFLKGSRRSAGFSVGRAEKIPVWLQKRKLGQGRIDMPGRVIAPLEVGVQPGDRLLAARGSGLALGFLACGPIYEVALKHLELEVFETVQLYGRGPP